MSDLEPHLLVVDDDARLRRLLHRYLSDNGFRVTLAADAAEARASLTSFAFDLIVLDVMMPGETGIELTGSLRGESGRGESGRGELGRGELGRGAAMPRVPILLLTAMGDPEDRVRGLEQGADDYLPKPFEPRELVLRIRNILDRRGAAGNAGGEAAGSIRFGAFRFDLGRNELFRGSEPVHLTSAEAGLLAALAARAGEAVSREDLSQSAAFSGNIRNVDVQMTRLRRKIEPDPRYPRYLQTVRGTGYALKPE